MFFIGQEHFMSQLGDILMYTYSTKSGVNILFRGASGYGKTELAKKCCNFLAGPDYETSLGNNPKFNPEIWVHFIDEVHKMENPEVLYPIMDSGKYILVFATNFDSILPEAFTNRCNNFVFTDYSDEELMEIMNYHSKLEFSDNIKKYIINVSSRNPRIIVKTFLNTLYMHFYKDIDSFKKLSDEELVSVIDKLFGIKNGLDAVSREYLETLKKLGGRASISLISSVMKLDTNTIKYDVEAGLLYKGLIKITSKGRELC